MLAIDGDEYEEVFPPDKFYVARVPSDATNVPTGTWFQKVSLRDTRDFFFIFSFENRTLILLMRYFRLNAGSGSIFLGQSVSW
jgi:hypothetical protein